MFAGAKIVKSLLLCIKKPYKFKVFLRRLKDCLLKYRESNKLTASNVCKQFQGRPKIRDVENDHHTIVVAEAAKEEVEVCFDYFLGWTAN